jgi:hypothetical protein
MLIKHYSPLKIDELANLSRPAIANFPCDEFEFLTPTIMPKKVTY